MEMVTRVIQNLGAKQLLKNRHHLLRHNAKMDTTMTNHSRPVSISMNACNMQMQISVVVILRWSASIDWVAMIVDAAVGSVAEDQTVIRKVKPAQPLKSRQQACRRNAKTVIITMMHNKHVSISMNANDMQIFAAEMLNALIG